MGISFFSVERITFTQILNDENKIFTILENEPTTIRFSISPYSRTKPNYAELHNSSESKFSLISSLNGGFMNLTFHLKKKIFPLN